MSAAELIARVESATGADRQIDLAIATTFYTREDWQWTYTPQWTASLDAVLALCAEKLPTYPVQLVIRPGGRSRAWLMNQTNSHEAATPALALLAALLRALDTQEPDHAR